MDSKPASSVADNVKVGNSLPLIPKTKQGHKCCGGCCDVRRATIIVNIITATLAGIGLLGMLAVSTASSNADEEMQQALNDVGGVFAGRPGLVIFGLIIRLIACGLGIWGAMNYTVWAVGVALAAYVLELIFDLLAFNIEGILISGFFAYPHVYFIKEVREGIMSKENYPHEEHSCCCV